MVSGRRITRFGLIRHAETHWNREKRIQGQQDSPLTPEGERQAGHWAAVLDGYGWDRCLCSDIGRARRTAAIINHRLNLPLMVEIGLREQDWGAWVGRTLKELKAEVPEALAKQVARGWRFRPPKGEDRNRVLSRGKHALEAAAARWPSADILTVTHEGMIKCLVYHCLNREFLPSEKPVLKSAHLHWLAVEDGRLRLEKLNALALNRPKGF